MNIFWHELRTHRQSLLVWSLSLSVVAIAFIVLYPAYSKDVDTIKQIMSNYPPALSKAFDLNIDIFFSFLGFYSYILTYIGLACAIQGLNLGIGMIAKEYSDKTADFLLAKPIGRGNIIVQKLFASVVILVLTNIFFVTTTYAVARMTASGFDTKIFILLAISLLPVQLIFLAIGMVISVSIKKLRSIVAISLPIVLGFYIIGVFDSIFDIWILRYMTPLKYFDTNYIIDNGVYEFGFIIISCVLIAAALVTSYVIFKRKDLPTGS